MSKTKYEITFREIVEVREYVECKDEEGAKYFGLQQVYISRDEYKNHGRVLETVDYLKEAKLKDKKEHLKDSDYWITLFEEEN